MELGAHSCEEPLVVSTGSVEGLEDPNTEVVPHAGIVKGACLQESPQDDGSKGCSVDCQGELHGVEKGITGGSEAFIVAVDLHLVVQLVGGLCWTVREDLQKVRVESTGDEDGFTIVIALDGSGSEQPTCQGIVL